MKVFHQTGHNYKWNIDSYQSDGAGDGFVLSPTNIPHNKLESLSDDVKNVSLFEPQIYLPDQPIKKLQTYEYFPGNLVHKFQSSDFEDYRFQLAKACTELQIKNNFLGVTIPIKHYEELPKNYFEKCEFNFVDPFFSVMEDMNYTGDVFLTITIRPRWLIDPEIRDEFLSWITGFSKITGVYLVFEKTFSSKQIKDVDFILNALIFIHELRQNDLDVLVGYTNNEGLIYSVADPNAVSMGSYERLRGFKLDNYKPKESFGRKGGPPKARIYSSKLMQWVDARYIPALDRRVQSVESLFGGSQHKPLEFNETVNWHLTSRGPYKHYFSVFYDQVQQLPSSAYQRIGYLKKKISNAIELFEEIQGKHGIRLDSNSDGSHLFHWFESLTKFEQYLQLSTDSYV